MEFKDIRTFFSSIISTVSCKLQVDYRTNKYMIEQADGGVINYKILLISHDRVIERRF